MEDKDSLEDSIPVWVLRPSTVEALATQLNPQKILLSDSGMEREYVTVASRTLLIMNYPRHFISNDVIFLYLFRSSKRLAWSFRTVRTSTVRTVRYPSYKSRQAKKKLVYKNHPNFFPIKYFVKFLKVMNTGYIGLHSECKKLPKKATLSF